MVIVRLIGGLGNQLFQYALGRRIAKTHGAQLKLDISSFATYKLHYGYALGAFDVKADIAAPEEVERLIGRPTLIRKMLRKVLGPRPRHIVEPHAHFAGNILSAPDDCYLEGYWQSEKYFADLRADLLEELEVRQPLEGRNAECAAFIADTNSVSLHIRRGDLVSNPQFNKVHGTCRPEYYEAAIAHIWRIQGSPHLFVFSDDIPWAREAIRPSCPVTFMDHNDGASAHEDLRLMALCRHNIIANSTFSWWGAWLNRNSQKIVIHPKRWFADPSAVEDYEKFLSDLIPHSWVAMPD
jgi:hypothetical protein